MFLFLKSQILKAAHNDAVRRVFHTFWQAAGGVLLAALFAAHSSQDVKLALGAALAAGLAAVKNLYQVKRG